VNLKLQEDMLWAVVGAMFALLVTLVWETRRDISRTYAYVKHLDSDIIRIINEQAPDVPPLRKS
jgi:hypothetical protein